MAFSLLGCAVIGYVIAIAIVIAIDEGIVGQFVRGGSLTEGAEKKVTTDPGPAPEPKPGAKHL